MSLACGRPTCECAYHTTGKGCRCKGMAAVECLVLAEDESPRAGKTVIGEKDLECPKCHRSEYVRNGRDRCRSGERQRYLCKGCGRRFRDNLGFERRHVSPMYITLALLLNGMGLSPANIQIALGHLGVDVHVDTVTRWLEHYVGLAEGYANAIRPPGLGERLGADEKRQDVRGRESYFVMAMDLATHFILAWEVPSTKIDYDATKLLQAAKARAGRPYRILITDGLSGYHTAFKKVFGALKGFAMHSISQKEWKNSG